MIFQIFALLISNSFAVIMGNDDRIDTVNSPVQYQLLGQSVAALIQKKNITENSDGSFSLKGPKLIDRGFCSNERFSNESIIANCSASLIAPNKILTAAHCFTNGYDCQTYSAVFDYQNDQENISFEKKLDKNSVYNCKSIDYYDFDTKNPSIDLAVITLDRDVENRVPLKYNLQQDLKVGDELFMIGFPLGITQKVVTNGRVLNIDKKFFSFKHNLDSFSVNSGGPIFNKAGIQVGVLTRGTGLNYSFDEKARCHRWTEGTSEDFSDGNDLSKIPKALLQTTPH